MRENPTRFSEYFIRYMIDPRSRRAGLAEIEGFSLSIKLHSTRIIRSPKYNNGLYFPEEQGAIVIHSPKQDVKGFKLHPNNVFTSFLLYYKTVLDAFWSDTYIHK